MNDDLSIRLASPSDAKQILEIYSPIIENTTISFETELPTESEIARRIEKTIQQLPWLVAIDCHSKILGYAYASPHRERAAYRWAVDVSAYIRDGFRGSGIGSRLYRELVGLLGKQNYFRAFAGIALPNEASISLHEKMGFKHLGTYQNVGFKFGNWHDVGWWELSLKDIEAKPPEPTPVKELLENV